MSDQKRNITGSYPGSSGNRSSRRTSNPFGSYPGKSRPAPEQPKKTEPAPLDPVEEPSVQEPKPEKRLFNFKKNKSQKPSASAEPTKEKEPRKKRRLSALFSKETLNRYWKTLAYYGCILVASVVLAGWICHVGNELFALIRPDKEYTVTIEEKSSTKEIAAALKEAGIIDHPVVFRLYCKLKKADGKFQFGEYTINCQRDYNQIIAALKRSAANKTMVKFTIQPGDTQEDLVTTLCDSLDYLEREELEKVLQTYDFSDFSFLKDLPERNYRLEGYLLPGEYETYNGESALAVVRRILTRFQEQVLTEENKKLITASGYSLDQIVTLSSVLQLEADQSLPKAAGVLLNRLKNQKFPYLQSRATVAYALPADNGPVTVADIRIEDPYNTYRVAGLPKGAICNPGLEAITAVLKPEKTECLYFVTGSDGTVRFAATEAEHLNNIKQSGEAPRGTGTVV